jgi:transcriptional regulator with XRE-family HTH domain
MHADMPRPSKRVAPDTLGGRLRAARQSLRLSLADVAGSKYSTSLISQIERNRVDPSAESLHYLADRLELPLEDLVTLARQHRESETEATLYKSYEEKYAEISGLLAHKQLALALERFKEFDPTSLPLFLRWRALALRGQIYFEQRDFSNAQRDFHSALTIMPSSIAEEYQLEAIKLRLHLAAATRELNQFEAALEYYLAALAGMDASTSLRYVAEAHWGLALVYYRQAQHVSIQDEEKTGEQKSVQQLLQTAWRHAEDARTLYNAIADNLNAALLQCQMALIEQAQGNVAQARQRLLAVLGDWQTSLEKDAPARAGARPHQLSDRANVVSAAACYLAGIESQDQRFEEALADIRLAIKAGRLSYKVRQAEAFIKLGEILEARNAADPEAERAFRQAVEVLRDTDRRVTRTQAHYQLGRHLLSIGKTSEGQQEMERARELAGIPRDFSTILPTDERPSNHI